MRLSNILDVSLTASLGRGQMVGSLGMRSLGFGALCYDLAAEPHQPPWVARPENLASNPALRIHPNVRGRAGIQGTAPFRGVRFANRSFFPRRMRRTNQMPADERAEIKQRESQCQPRFSCIQYRMPQCGDVLPLAIAPPAKAMCSTRTAEGVQDRCHPVQPRAKPAYAGANGEFQQPILPPLHFPGYA